MMVGKSPGAGEDLFPGVEVALAADGGAEKSLVEEPPEAGLRWPWDAK